MDGAQLENGYTRIANEILENIPKARLSPTQHSLIYVIWRYTYGFGRKEHNMSLSFMAKATGLDLRNIQRELKRLEQKSIIFQTINKSRRVISFNKNFNEWILTFGETDNGDIDNGKTDKCLNRRINIGETDKGSIGETDNQERNKENSKETSLSEKYSDGDIPLILAEELAALIKGNKPTARIGNLKKWALEFDRMIRIDNRTPLRIREVMTWAQRDTFWRCNILSAIKLRDKFDTLELRMDSEKPKEQQKRNIIM